MNQIDLRGRKAIVTGGGGGIGLAVVERFLTSGARVSIWDFDPSIIDGAKRRFQQDLHTLLVDVTDERAVVAGMEQTARDLGGIDILVNAAGIAGRRLAIRDCTLSEWSRVLDVNLTGTFLCCREALKYMRGTGYGRVVNVASIAGKEGNALAGHYSAAKAAVIALGKSLAKEEIDTGITVNCIAPAAVQTALFEGMPPDRQRAAAARIPMGRVGRAEEIAAMIAWICSEECSFTTGFTFDASGGRATY